MEELNKLGTMKRCPKCGGEHFKLTFTRAITQERLTGESLIIESEYMNVECNRCLFIKKEKPLDAKEDEG